jgi:hypothetical protein
VPSSAYLVCSRNMLRENEHHSLKSKVQNIAVFINDSEDDVTKFYSRQLITRKQILGYLCLAGLKTDVLQDSSQASAYAQDP